MLRVETIHHISLPVSDLTEARAFYGGVLGLTEIARPAFPFEGAWYELGDRHLHLIITEGATFRAGKAVSTSDIHLAIRVASYAEAVEHLRAHGYMPNALDDRRCTREQPHGPAGFPQLFVMDPDRHLIEINAERID